MIKICKICFLNTSWNIVWDLISKVVLKNPNYLYNKALRSYIYVIYGWPYGWTNWLNFLGELVVGTPGGSRRLKSRNFFLQNFKSIFFSVFKFNGQCLALGKLFKKILGDKDRSNGTLFEKSVWKTWIYRSSWIPLRWVWGKKKHKNFKKVKNYHFLKNDNEGNEHLTRILKYFSGVSQDLSEDSNLENSCLHC